MSKHIQAVILKAKFISMYERKYSTELKQSITYGKEYLTY